MKKKVGKIKPYGANIRQELRALKQAARNARRLADITGTGFIVVRNGRMVNLNEGRKQSNEQKQLVKLLRPFGI
jgi:hypothetical protein